MVKHQKPVGCPKCGGRLSKSAGLLRCDKCGHIPGQFGGRSDLLSMRDQLETDYRSETRTPSRNTTRGRP